MWLNSGLRSPKVVPLERFQAQTAFLSLPRHLETPMVMRRTTAGAGLGSGSAAIGCNMSDQCRPQCSLIILHHFERRRPKLLLLSKPVSYSPSTLPTARSTAAQCPTTSLRRGAFPLFPSHGQRLGGTASTMWPIRPFMLSPGSQNLPLQWTWPARFDTSNTWNPALSGRGGERGRLEGIMP
jgi:hypothetical protein